MSYRHIKDCWEAIEDISTTSELEKLLEEFPRWSGDWEYYLEKITPSTTLVTVRNIWFDVDMGWSGTEKEFSHIKSNLQFRGEHEVYY